MAHLWSSQKAVTQKKRMIVSPQSYSSNIQMGSPYRNDGAPSVGYLQFFAGICFRQVQIANRSVIFIKFLYIFMRSRFFWGKYYNNVKIILKSDNFNFNLISTLRLTCVMQGVDDCVFMYCIVETNLFPENHN